MLWFTRGLTQIWTQFSASFYSRLCPIQETEQTRITTAGKNLSVLVSLLSVNGPCCRSKVAPVTWDVCLKDKKWLRQFPPTHEGHAQGLHIPRESNRQSPYLTFPVGHCVRRRGTIQTHWAAGTDVADLHTRLNVPTPREQGQMAWRSSWITTCTSASVCENSWFTAAVDNVMLLPMGQCLCTWQTTMWIINYGWNYGSHITCIPIEITKAYCYPTLCFRSTQQVRCNLLSSYYKDTKHSLWM